MNMKKTSWRRRVDVNMAFYVVLILVLIGLNIFFKSTSEVNNKECAILLGSMDGNLTESSNFEVIECIFMHNSILMKSLQLLVCYLQLMIIVGLCLDSGKS